MKCPKCTLVTSNKRDLCPRCHFDLRPRKRELSIPVTHPNATVEQLLKTERTQDDAVRASAMAALNAGPALQAATPAKTVKKKKKRKKSEPKPTFWQKLFASLFTKKPKADPEPEAAVEQSVVEPAAIIALPMLEPVVQMTAPETAVIEAHASELDLPGFELPSFAETSVELSADGSVANVSTAPASFPLQTDAGAGEDKELEELLLALEEGGGDIEDELFARTPVAPIDGDVSELLKEFTGEDAASDDLSAAEEIDPFAAMEASLTDAVEAAAYATSGLQTQSFDSPTTSPLLNTPVVAPAVMEFNEEDDSLFEQQLDEMIGDEILGVEAVKVAKPAAPKRAESVVVEDDLEFTFEMEIEEEHAPAPKTPATDPLTGGMMDVFDVFEATTQHQKIDAEVSELDRSAPDAAATFTTNNQQTVAPQVRSADELRKAQELLARLPSVDDGIAEELTKLLASAYGIHPEILRTRTSAPGDEVLNELSRELDQEIEGLLADGTTFLTSADAPIEESLPAPSEPELIDLADEVELDVLDDAEFGVEIELDASSDLDTDEALDSLLGSELERLAEPSPLPPVEEVVTTAAPEFAELEALQAELGAELEALEREGLSIHHRDESDMLAAEPLEEAVSTGSFLLSDLEQTLATAPVTELQEESVATEASIDLSEELDTLAAIEVELAAETEEIAVDMVAEPLEEAVSTGSFLLSDLEQALTAAPVTELQEESVATKASIDLSEELDTLAAIEVELAAETEEIAVDMVAEPLEEAVSTGSFLLSDLEQALAAAPAETEAMIEPPVSIEFADDLDAIITAEANFAHDAGVAQAPLEVTPAVDPAVSFFARQIDEAPSVEALSVSPLAVAEEAVTDAVTEVDVPVALELAVGDSPPAETNAMVEAAPIAVAPTELDLETDAEESHEPEMLDLTGDEELDLGNLMGAFLTDDPATSPVLVKAYAAKPAPYDTADSLGSALNTGVFLARDLQNIIAKDPAQSTAVLAEANTLRWESLPAVADSLWSDAHTAVSEHSAEIELSSGDLAAKPDEKLITLLFQVARDELVNPELAKRHQEQLPGSHKKQIENDKLDSALKSFASEAKVAVAKKRAEAARAIEIQPLPEIPPAAAWRRLVAMVIDLTVVVAISATFVVSALFTSEMKSGLMIGDLPDPLRLLPMLGSSIIVAFVTWLLTSTLLVGGWGQTVGGKAMKLEVVTRTGALVGFGRAFLRACAQTTTMLTCGLGLLPLLGGSRRTLHDRLACTCVRMREDD